MKLGVGIGVVGRYVDTVVPTVTSIEVGAINDQVIQIFISEALDTGSTPATGDFSVAGTTGSISNISVGLGTSVLVTLDAVIYDYETVTISYTAGGNPLQDPAGNAVANFSNQAVTNNSSISHPVIIDSSDTVAFFDSALGITKDGSNFVSNWADQSGEDNHLLQATGTNQPLWSSTGVLFDGVDNLMKCVAFTLVQPEMLYLVLKQVSWTSPRYLFSGDVDGTHGGVSHDLPYGAMCVDEP